LYKKKRRKAFATGKIDKNRKKSVWQTAEDKMCG
jgi:hypothetical protein